MNDSRTSMVRGPFKKLAIITGLLAGLATVATSVTGLVRTFDESTEQKASTANAKVKLSYDLLKERLQLVEERILMKQAKIAEDVEDIAIELESHANDSSVHRFQRPSAATISLGGSTFTGPSEPDKSEYSDAEGGSEPKYVHGLEIQQALPPDLDKALENSTLKE